MKIGWVIMMNRIISALLVMILSLMLSAYAAAEDASASSNQPANNESAVSLTETTQRVIQEENGYQISEIIDTNGEATNLLVRVYDCNRMVIYEHKFLPTFRGRIYVSKWDENIVMITLNVGTSLNYTQFCDRKNSRVSPVYTTPLLVGNGKVVAPERGKLIVSDMFDKNVYYKEIILEDFADVAVPANAFREVKWEREGKLSIAYLTGTRKKEYIERTVMVDL